MRLFVALELNSKVITNLTELVRRLRSYAPIAWVHPQNMHVTLKYIGEWPDEKLDRVIDVLSEVHLQSPLTVPLAGMGFFPSADKPRVFWVGAENTTALRRLASSVDAQLQELGVAPEVRPFFPHLTLGRLREDHDLTELNHAIEELPSREFGAISPDRFVLFESTPTPNGPIYRRIQEFPIAAPLGGEEAPVLRARAARPTKIA